jgi:hypothetical protein
LIEQVGAKFLAGDLAVGRLLNFDGPFASDPGFPGDPLMDKPLCDAEAGRKVGLRVRL